MIMVLLNLAYIPDNVILNIKDFEPGWSTRFKQAMIDYKNNFNLKYQANEKGSHGQVYDTKWMYQCEELEKRYADFMVNRDAALLELKMKKLEKQKGYQAPKNMYEGK